jgi:acyl-CoA thioesterase I
MELMNGRGNNVRLICLVTGLPFMTKSLCRFFLLIVFSICDLVFSWALSAPVDPSNYILPVRVACVGDSITQGIGAEQGKSYPNQLQGILGPKWKVWNFGVSGRTVLKKGDHPYWDGNEIYNAKSYQPDVVVIMLGTNDTKPQNWSHRQDFVADYKDLVENFKTLASKPRVFICRPCPVFGEGNYGINESNLKIEMPLIDQIAAEEKIDVIDVHAALDSKPDLLPDRVHPNSVGAGLIAGTVASGLTGKIAATK